MDVSGRLLTRGEWRRPHTTPSRARVARGRLMGARLRRWAFCLWKDVFPPPLALHPNLGLLGFRVFFYVQKIVAGASWHHHRGGCRAPRARRQQNFRKVCACDFMFKASQWLLFACVLLNQTFQFVTTIVAGVICHVCVARQGWHKRHHCLLHQDLCHVCRWKPLSGTMPYRDNLTQAELSHTPSDTLNWTRIQQNAHQMCA